jgi:multidrug resistance protein, MATE family
VAFVPGDESRILVRRMGVGNPALREELAATVKLAWPVVIAELGWMAMGVVDTVMVGRLSPEALGAVGMGSTIFLAIGIFGMGLLLGLDPLVAQAYGAGSLKECHRWLVHGIYLALLVTGPVIAITYAVTYSMPAWGVHTAVLDIVQPYLWVVAWSALPLLVYAALRRYLQALHVVKPVMFALVSANIINAVANWVLIYGHFGFPELGPVGAAWATLVSRVYMAAVLVAAIVVHERARRTGLWATPLRADRARLVQLARLGAPAAMQLVAEVGVFAAATALAGRLNPIALASHQIALNLVGVSFMFPYGVSSAGAVRVGNAAGRRDSESVGRSGWAAIAIGVGVMAVAAVLFFTIPETLVRLFSSDASVVALGSSLLFVAAIFQLFDGLQVVATGVLRGIGNTHTAMISNLVGHWVLGLPVGYLLCFRLDWGVMGLWVGLSIGLIAVGSVLLIAWSAQLASVRRTLEPLTP